MSTTPNTNAPHRAPGAGGWYKIPAPPYEVCPKCGGANYGRAVSVWRVAYAAGGPAFLECDTCSFSEPYAG